MTMHNFRRRLVAAIAIPALIAAPRATAQSAAAGSKYLFVWTGDGARTVSDFLVVLDADPASGAYGHVVASLPVGAVGTMPHHTEYEFPADGMLLANGWASSRTFLIDLRTPTAPKLAGSFGSVGAYSFPHSFARLPNGHLLGTFQGAGRAYAPPGGLVELDEHGKLVRGVSTAGMGITDTLAWPYSLAVDAKRDRVITTNTTMPIPKWLKAPQGSWRKGRVDSIVTSQVQIWRTSDLKLLKTLALPKPPGRGRFADSSANLFPAEPRVLPDGSFYVNTFLCGLYHLTGVDGPAARATFVHSFPIAADKYCAVPAIVGHYWIQTDMALPGLIALDISNPDVPIEVSRLVLASRFAMPHWLASDPKANRVVLTGDDMGYVAIVNVDPRTGALSLDQKFRDEKSGTAGVNLSGRTWPHGAVKNAYVHGTLFGRR
jgi:hypothetical protein